MYLLIYDVLWLLRFFFFLRNKWLLATRGHANQYLFEYLIRCRPGIFAYHLIQKLIVCFMCENWREVMSCIALERSLGDEKNNYTEKHKRKDKCGPLRNTDHNWKKPWVGSLFKGSMKKLFQNKQRSKWTWKGQRYFQLSNSVRKRTVKLRAEEQQN